MDPRYVAQGREPAQCDASHVAFRRGETRVPCDAKLVPRGALLVSRDELLVKDGAQLRQLRGAQLELRGEPSQSSDESWCDARLVLPSG